jgi:sporulation protein YlmC with PRC-barrel domain
MRLSDASLVRRTVIASDGLAIGTVSALFVECEAWRVEALEIKLRNDIADRIGADHSIFRSGTIEIPTRMVQSVGDAVLLSSTVLELRDALEPATGTTG